MKSTRVLMVGLCRSVLRGWSKRIIIESDVFFRDFIRSKDQLPNRIQKFLRKDTVLEAMSKYLNKVINQHV